MSHPLSPLTSAEAIEIHRRYNELPGPEREALATMALELEDGIKKIGGRNFGPDSAIITLWAIGRLLRRKREVA